MNINDRYDQLTVAVSDDGGEAGVALEAVYQPALPGGKISPPTFPPATSDPNGSPRYAMEDRLIDGVRRSVVAVDTVASQANRMEARLDELALAAALPLVEMTEQVGDNTARVSSWTAPHRHADAYFEHALLDGVPYWESPEGAELMAAQPQDAAALLRWFPGALLFGSWTSRKKGRPARFPRVVSSEMIGLDPVEGERLGVRADPLNLQKGTSTLTKKRLSDVGLGMIPAGSKRGGVTVSEVRRLGWLSFAGLRLLGFGGERDTAGRALLAALALWADRLAFGSASLWLRSGCDLLRTNESLTWVASAEDRAPLDLSVDDAHALFDLARDRAEAAGASMARETRKLTADSGLREAMEFTLLRAEDE